MKLNKNKELNEKNKIVNQQERKILNNDKKLEKKMYYTPKVRFFMSNFWGAVQILQLFYDGRLFFKNSRMPKAQLKEVAKKMNSPGPINRIPSKSIIV